MNQSSKEMLIDRFSLTETWFALVTMNHGKEKEKGKNSTQVKV